MPPRFSTGAGATEIGTGRRFSDSRARLGAGSERDAAGRSEIARGRSSIGAGRGSGWTSTRPGGGIGSAAGAAMAGAGWDGCFGSGRGGDDEIGLA
jgi:hypothetical protein